MVTWSAQAKCGEYVIITHNLVQELQKLFFFIILSQRELSLHNDVQPNQKLYLPSGERPFLPHLSCGGCAELHWAECVQPRRKGLISLLSPSSSSSSSRLKCCNCTGNYTQSFVDMHGNRRRVVLSWMNDKHNENINKAPSSPSFPRLHGLLYSGAQNDEERRQNTGEKTERIWLSSARPATEAQFWTREATLLFTTYLQV